MEGSDSDGLFVNVLGVDGSIRISDEGNLPAEGENELIFPQIGNGSFPGGKIAVLMVFVNRTLMGAPRVALSLTSTLAFTFFGSALAQTPVPGSLLEGVFFVCEGDINLDGERGPGDLALLAAHLTGEQLLSGEALFNADVNLDGIVGVGDQVRLLRHNTGEFPLTPCGDFAPIEVACPDLLLERESAAPMDRVGLGALPAELREPTVAVVTEESGELGLFTIVERENGSATLFTPFYPGVSAAGGAVKVQVTDGIRACPALDFTINYRRQCGIT